MTEVPSGTAPAGMGAVPQRHTMLRSGVSYGVVVTISPAITAFASLPNVATSTPSSMSMDTTYFPLVSVALADMPAATRLAGASPRLKNASATGPFDCAAMLRPSATCARIV
jgi:hypothetical protein